MQPLCSRVLQARCRQPWWRANVTRTVVSCLAVLVAAFTCHEAHGRPGTLSDTCSEIPGQVSFGALRVVPPMPAVGEAVELHIDTGIAVYSLLGMVLTGAAPLLEGETSLHGTRDATFHLTAVQAGRATVQLSVTYATEEQCIDSYGYPYINSYGPDRTVTSAAYVVDIGPAPTAGACVGDCDRNGEVTVDELLTMVRIALGETAIFSVPCRAADPDGSADVQITEIVAAVERALIGCPGPEYGTCYESSTCVPDPDSYFSFPASRGRCCQLWLSERGIPFTWCSAELIDPSSGECTRCAPPC